MHRLGRSKELQRDIHSLHWASKSSGRKGYLLEGSGKDEGHIGLSVAGPSGPGAKRVATVEIGAVDCLRLI